MRTQTSIQFSRLKYVGLSLFAAQLVIAASTAAAAIPEKFIARVKTDLCPEYSQGGVVFETYYTVGSDPALNAAKIVHEEFDTLNNKATLELEFPANLGTTPFNVVSYCRNARGYGTGSNVRSVSNCDALAIEDYDADGVPNNLEDTDCNYFFNPGDFSNVYNVDTDGDGVRDLVEIFAATSPSNPGSSPRPFIYESASFDADGDGNSNALVWRPSTGTWFLRDFGAPDNTLSIQFGTDGDVPFTYKPKGFSTTYIGTIRRLGNDLQWYFYGAGFQKKDGPAANAITFGVFGDNIIPGPWEAPGVTNPAVARVFNGVWTFDIYLSDGTVRQALWGGNGDVPKVDDYDGDGLFDIAVYRPSENKTYAIASHNNSLILQDFGSPTGELTVRGDYSGDGKAEISFWEPLTGVFYSLLSDNGYDPVKAAMQDPLHLFSMQLGLYNIHLPLNWNRQSGKTVYTVVDHAQGLRYWRDNNDANGQIKQLQWGLPGDHQG